MHVNRLDRNKAGCEIAFMSAEAKTTRSADPVQLCPKCRIPMSVSDVIPTMPTTGFDEDEVVYRCHQCGAQVKQVIERRRPG